MAITKFGTGIVIGSWVIFLIFFLLSIYFYQPAVIVLVVFSGIFSIFNLFFFRDPDRIIPDNSSAILAPADGKVVQLIETDEDDFIKDRSYRVSIFLSIFNVHVNRVPISGRVEYFRYIPGKFFAAFKEKASLNNERTVVGISNQNGQQVLFKQIAGTIARRIICVLREGHRITAGERLGMIRYGSRVDVFFPVQTCKVKVKLGDVVKGGTTILGVFE